MPLKRLMDNNLTLVIPILLTLLSNAYILLFIYLTISLNSLIMIICKSNDFELFTILMPFSRDMVAFDIIITGALGGMALIPCYTMTLVVNI